MYTMRYFQFFELDPSRIYAALIARLSCKAFEGQGGVPSKVECLRGGF